MFEGGEDVVCRNNNNDRMTRTLDSIALKKGFEYIWSVSSRVEEGNFNSDNGEMVTFRLNINKMMDANNEAK